MQVIETRKPDLDYLKELFQKLQKVGQLMSESQPKMALFLSDMQYYAI